MIALKKTGNRGGSGPRLSILLPVRNEGLIVETVLRFIPAVVETPHEILLVYDEPDDDTVPAVKGMRSKPPNIRLVHNKKGRGVANAILSGVEVARGNYVVLAVVDEILPLLAVDDMVALMDEGCDLVSCTRYAHGGCRLAGSYIQRILSGAGNRIFSVVSGSILSDSTTGGKMFKKTILDELRLESRIGWAVAFELAIKAQAAGLRLGEVPIISVDRFYGGSSTFVLGSWFREYLRLFLWGVGRLHRIRKEKPKVRIPQVMR